MGWPYDDPSIENSVHTYGVVYFQREPIRFHKSR